jgi:hypothetical protein
MSSKLARKVSMIRLTSSMACCTPTGDAGWIAREGGAGVSAWIGAGSGVGTTGSAACSAGGGASWGGAGAGRCPRPLRPRPPRRPLGRDCDGLAASAGAAAGSDSCSGAMPQVAPCSTKCNAKYTARSKASVEQGGARHTAIKLSSS